MKILHIHPHDNVAIAIQPLQAGEIVNVANKEITCNHAIPMGHKLAIATLNQGDNIIKYGHIIGHATVDIKAGDWVHADNLATNLKGETSYHYSAEKLVTNEKVSNKKFMGYRRANGKVGTRNEIWVINTVGCVNTTAQRIAELSRSRHGYQVDGIYTFVHPFGCSQLGDDLTKTRAILAGLAVNPNAGGILVLGLGCENNQLPALVNEIKKTIGTDRIRYFNSQSVDDEVEAGLLAVDELVTLAKADKREEVPLSELVVGLKCGGSDGFSGLTANPLLGRITDKLTAAGGTAILGEVPEMFGAEQQLMNRSVNETVFKK